MAAYQITSVSIQGMRSVDSKTYSLSKATYLHGPNGAGKSTVLNAIQLCLLGYIPQVGKSNSAIMANANSSRMKVSVSLVDENENEAEISRTFELKGSKCSSSVSCFPESLDIGSVVGNCELPVFNWSEFNSLTANKLKDWFIKFLPNDKNDEINWHDKLSKCLDSDPVYCTEIVDEYSKAFSSIKKESAVERIAEANKSIKDNLSYSKAVLSEKENALNGMQDAVDVDVDKESLAEAQSQYAAASEKSSKAVAIKDASFANLNKIKQDWQLYSKVLSNCPSSSDVERVQRLADEAKNQKDKCHALVSKAQEQCNLRESNLMELNARKKSMAERMEYLKSQSVKDTCPITGNPCKDASLAFEKYSNDIKAAKAEFDALKKGIADASAARAEALSNLSHACEKYDEACRELELRESELSSMTKRQKAAKEAAQPEQSMDEAQDQFDQACQEFAECKSREIEASNLVATQTQQLKYQSLIDKTVKEKYQLEEKISILKKWEKLTSENGMQTDYAKNQFESLESDLGKQIEKTFQDGSKCRIKVSNKSNSFSFGVDRNGSYIPYSLLSTGEQALYAFSLMLYMCKKSSAQLKIVLMDDFFDHLDSNRFDRIMQCVSTDLENVQIVMAGVNSCSSEFVKKIEISR